MTRLISSIYSKANAPAPTATEAKRRNRDACAEAWQLYGLAKNTRKVLCENENIVIKRQPAECLQHCDGPNRNGSYGDHVMATMPLPAPEVLRQLLRYEPDTGKLFWRGREREWFVSLNSFRAWNTRYAGKRAFTAFNAQGYRIGRLLGKGYLAHRVAFAIHYGEWPVSEIDHLNGDRADNQVSNLRQASRFQNCCNKNHACLSKSGFRGVSMRRGKFRAQIQFGGKAFCLGSFETAEAAAAAYDDAAKKHHGEFATLNFY